MICIYCNIYMYNSSSTTSISTPMHYRVWPTHISLLEPLIWFLVQVSPQLLRHQRVWLEIWAQGLSKLQCFFSMRGLNGTHFFKGITLDTKMWLVILEGFRLESAWRLGWRRLVTPCILVVSYFKSSTFQKYFGSTYLRTLGILLFHHPAGFCCSLRCPGPGWSFKIK